MMVWRCAFAFKLNLLVTSDVSGLDFVALLFRSLFFARCIWLKRSEPRIKRTTYLNLILNPDCVGFHMAIPSDLLSAVIVTWLLWMMRRGRAQTSVDKEWVHRVPLHSCIYPPRSPSLVSIFIIFRPLFALCTFIPPAMSFGRAFFRLTSNAASHFAYGRAK